MTNSFYKRMNLDSTLDVWVECLNGYSDKMDYLLLYPEHALGTRRYKKMSYRERLVLLAQMIVADRAVEMLDHQPHADTLRIEFSRMSPVSVKRGSNGNVQPMWELVGGNHRLRRATEIVLHNPSKDESWRLLKKTMDELIFDKTGKEPWK